MKTFKNNQILFKGNSKLNWEPMKLKQNWLSTVSFWSSFDYSRCMILNQLKSMEIFRWHVEKKAITIIYERESVFCQLCSFERRIKEVWWKMWVPLPGFEPGPRRSSRGLSMPLTRLTSRPQSHTIRMPSEALTPIIKLGHVFVIAYFVFNWNHNSF